MAAKFKGFVGVIGLDVVSEGRDLFTVLLQALRQFAGEGFLLLARVWWATYFTIAMTLCGIPIEILEIWRRPERFRSWFYLVVNISILAYLWYRRNEFRDDFRELGITPPRGAAR